VIDQRAHIEVLLEFGVTGRRGEVGWIGYWPVGDREHGIEGEIVSVLNLLVILEHIILLFCDAAIFGIKIGIRPLADAMLPTIHTIDQKLEINHATVEFAHRKLLVIPT